MERSHVRKLALEVFVERFYALKSDNEWRNSSPDEYRRHRAKPDP